MGENAIGYLRFDAERPDVPAIVAAHGWPSTLLELVPLARRLATPSGFGAEPSDALTVIVPALPGLPGSPQRSNDESTHHVWHRPMMQPGFDRYFAHDEPDLPAEDIRRFVRTMAGR